MDSFRPAPGTLSQPLTISIRRQRSRRVDRAVPASSVSTLDYAPRLPPERGSCEPRAVSPGTPLGRGAALRQVRHVIERLLRDGTAVAVRTGHITTYSRSLLAQAKGRRCGSGSPAKVRRIRSRSALDTASRGCSSVKPCSPEQTRARGMSCWTRIRRRDSPIAAYRFSTRQGLESWWSSTRRIADRPATIPHRRTDLRLRLRRRQPPL